MDSTVALVDSLYGKSYKPGRAVEVAIEEARRSRKQGLWYTILDFFCW